MTAGTRIRGRTWQTMRRTVLDAEPLCRTCKAAGRVQLAEEVDHIRPLCRGGDNSRANLAPICRSCHAEKTARDLGHQPKRPVGLDGWPM